MRYGTCRHRHSAYLNKHSVGTLFYHLRVGSIENLLFLDQEYFYLHEMVMCAKNVFVETGTTVNFLPIRLNKIPPFI